MRVLLFALISLLLAVACVYFVYYTVRLAYVNLTGVDISAHRQAGMYIGAVGFPAASLVFGYVCLWCARAALRAARTGERP
jgi:hypothetical protein